MYGESVPLLSYEMLLGISWAFIGVSVAVAAVGILALAVRKAWYDEVLLPLIAVAALLSLAAF